MLDIFINVALLLTATGLAALSFFGKPWKDQNAPKKEVTSHGVLTIVLWCIALTLGITKEVRSKRTSDQQRRDTQKATSETDTAQKKLIEQEHHFEINQLREQLQLQVAESKADKAKAVLDEMRTKVGKVQQDLSSGNDEATRQNTASLITSLAGSDQKVREVIVDLPFTNQVQRSSTFMGALLPGFSRDVCKQYAGIMIATSLTSASTYLDYLSSKDTSPLHQFPEQDPGTVAQLYSVGGKGSSRNEIENLNTGLQQSSWNGNLIEEELRLPAGRQSAAAIVSSLTSGTVTPLLLRSQWPAEILYSQYATTLSPHANLQSFAMPAECSSQIRKHFSAGFDKAALTLVLDQKQNEMIVFPLKVTQPHILPNGDWVVSFQVNGSLRIGAAPLIESRFLGESISPGTP